MAYVSRDPFAREELHREEIKPAPGRTCVECGNTNRRGNLYEYRTERDSYGSRPSTHRGLFCSRACHRAYHQG